MCPGQFGWNELLSTDVEASKKFYSGLLGWTTAAGPGPDYTIFRQGEKGVGGLMKVPQPGMPAQWLAYVVVENVDATTAKVAGLGGKVMAQPFDIPNVGRIAVILDPQGASIGLFQSAM